MGVSPHPEQTIPGAKVVQGKDGWLFLHRDTNRVMDQQSGRTVLTPNQLMQWRLMLESRAAWVERRDARHVFLVAPNAASIYPEMLPEGYTSSPRRPVHQLLEHLAEHRSPVDVVYPDAELIALKDREAPYARNETHWVDPGAFRAYEVLLDHLEPAVEARRLTRDACGIASAPVCGDLGRKMEPEVEADHLFMHVRGPRARVVADNRVHNNGRRIDYECNAAPGTCVVFGDSFAYGMLPFLAESFGRLLFVHRPTLDFELIASERPAVVIGVLNERFLVRVPFDQPYTPTRVLARKKREAGKMLAPREPNLRPDMWPPLDLAEG